MSENKNRFLKRFKIYMLLSAALLVAILATLLILITTRFKDNNRSSYQNRNLSYTEIVKKNYINGFENTKNTGKFSYILPNEDINELLSLGLKSLNDKHIKNIYFDTDQNGLRYFFVDLAKVGVKTRVVISTVPSVKDTNTIKLSIASVSMGKVNALTLLQKRGYLSNDYINPYFKACHLPISFDQDNLSFEVKPYDWIKIFPTSAIGDYLFSTSKSIENAYSFNSNVFGFNLDISKLSSGKEFTNVDTSHVPNIYDEVKEGCISQFPSMSDGETKRIYSFSEEDLNKHIKSSFVSEIDEEITSTLINTKVGFKLVGANVHIDKIDELTLTLFFSINGYLLDVDTTLTYVSSPLVYFGAYFQKHAISSPMINAALSNVLSKLTDKYSYFDYTASEMLYLNLESLNEDIDIEDTIKYSQKSVELNHSDKTIDFKLTK